MQTKSEQKAATIARAAARAAKRAPHVYAATEVFLDALLATLKKSSDTLDSRKAS